MAGPLVAIGEIGLSGLFRLGLGSRCHGRVIDDTPRLGDGELEALARAQATNLEKHIIAAIIIRRALTAQSHDGECVTYDLDYMVYRCPMAMDGECVVIKRIKAPLMAALHQHCNSHEMGACYQVVVIDPGLPRLAANWREVV